MTTSKRGSALLAVALLAACTSSARPNAAVTITTPPARAPLEPVSTEWRVLAGAPTERLEVAAAVLDQRIYVMGGLLADGNATDRVEIYDPATNSWSAGPSLPVAVHHAMGATFRDEVVVAGGFEGGGFTTASASVFALRDGAWTSLPDLRRPRAAGGAVVVRDRLVLVGGQDGATLVEPTEIFDGTAWRDGARIPTPRDHLGVAADERYVYAVTGRLRSIDASVKVLERYDVVANRWKRLAPPRVARGGIGAAVVSDSLIVLGGENPAAEPNGVYGVVERFTIASGRWDNMRAPMPTPRHGVGVAVIGPTIYVACGGSMIGASTSGALEALTVPGDRAFL